MKLTYFNIQRFCLRDGPGIRTVLFLKGCHLSCLWCHNPEGQSALPEILFRSDKCTACGRCLGFCSARSMKDGALRFERPACTACGKCAEACLADCSEVCGIEEDASSVFEKLIRDRAYFEESGGGITVSGGEPLAQYEAVFALASAAKEAGVAFAVETSGYADAESLLRLHGENCLFLYDIKGADDAKHIINTGVSNAKIIENLDVLTNAGADIVLRLPLIPGFNDSEEDLEKLSALLSKYVGKVRRAEIMPYHRIGVGKLASLGRDPGTAAGIPDGKSFAPEWSKILERSGMEVKVN